MELGEFDGRPDQRGRREESERRGKAVSTGADASLIDEELFSFEYFMRVSFIIALPVLIILAVYNALMGRIVAVALLCSMGILFLWVYSKMRKFQSKSLSPEQKNRIYQNTIRGFLLIFLILTGYFYSDI